MFNLKVASFALPLLLSQVLPSTASGLPRLAQPLIERAEGEGIIEALLRRPNSPRSASGLFGRQSGTCDPGYLPCSDGNGCCPVGKYCGVWGGKPGCCTIGKTCVANNNPCDYQGYVPCVGEDFCCPAGDTCSRDATGARQCLRNSPTFTTPHTTATPPGFTSTFTNTFGNTNTFNTDFFPSTTSDLQRTTISTTPKATATGGLLPNPFSSNSSNGAPASAGAVSALLIVLGLAINALAR